MVSGRCAIIIAISLATSAGSAELDPARHLFPLRRTDQTKAYPRLSVITSVRNQAVLTHGGEGRFSGYYRFWAIKSYGHHRLKIHSPALTSMSTDQRRRSKVKSNTSKWPPTSPIPTSLPAQAAESSPPVNPLAESAAPPTSPGDIVGAQPAVSTATGAESNADERGNAFALSPSSELSQWPSPSSEPQREPQQKNTEQTPSPQMAQQETTPRPEITKPQDSAISLNAVLAAPGVAPDSDTSPAKFSEKKAADDRLVTFAYTFKLLKPRGTPRDLSGSQGTARRASTEGGYWRQTPAGNRAAPDAG